MYVIMLKLGTRSYRYNLDIPIQSNNFWLALKEGSFEGKVLKLGLLAQGVTAFI